MDEFTVVEGHGKALLGKDTAQKLNVLRVGPPNYPQAYSITREGNYVDIVKSFADVFSGVGKLKDYQLKLHVNKDVKPVAQPFRRLPFGLREKVDKKLDELLREDIIEGVPSGPTEWISPLVVVPKPRWRYSHLCGYEKSQRSHRARETSHSYYRGSPA